MRLYTPANGVNPQTAAMVFPGHDISFLHGIAPVGDKFLAPAALGPQGARHVLDGSAAFEGTRCASRHRGRPKPTTHHAHFRPAETLLNPIEFALHNLY